MPPHSASRDTAPPHRPHILFILADQLRHDFLGAYGAGFVDTPNIDRIGREGVRYANAYSPHPVCVSARVSLLTGHDAMVTGALNNGNFLRPDHREVGLPTWPELLSEAGYHTCAVGKMHFYPWDLGLGFRDRIICEDKRWLAIEDDYWHFLRERGHRKYHGNEHAGYLENRGAVVSRLPWDCYWDHFVGSQAAGYINEYEDNEPLALMVGFPGPHCPYDPTAEFLERIDASAMPPAIPEVAGDHPRLRQSNIDGNRGAWNGVDYTEFTEAHKRKIRAHYCALVTQIDDQVGAILRALEDRGMLDDTLVVFGSDHGDYLGDHNLIGKGTFFEGSCHVPLLVRPPAGGCTGDPSPGQAATAGPSGTGGPAAAAAPTTPGHVCPDLVSLTDVNATLRAFAGLEAPHTPDTRPLPGLGLPTASRDVLCGDLAGAWMAFDGRHKLAKYGTGEHHLFDLDADPAEQRNLLKAGGAEADYRRLDAALTEHTMRCLRLAHGDKQIYTRDLSGDAAFGRRTWRRTYPHPLNP